MFCGKQELKLWYDSPAPFGNENLRKWEGSSASEPDDGWEKWSLPLGNGYLGACVFGRTKTEDVYKRQMYPLMTLFRRGGNRGKQFSVILPEYLR